MTSIIANAAKTAHSTAAALLAKAQILPGQAIPSPITIKEDAADKPTSIVLKGRNIIVGVPGAFTGTCSAQVPGYIEAYDQFKAKGINDIFIVAVNDVFVNKAWKENLASNGTAVRFLSDDNGEFVSSIGLVFDASPLLGGPRSKRFALITEDDKVVSVAVEEDPSQLTVTSAKTILAQVS